MKSVHDINFPNASLRSGFLMPQMRGLMAGGTTEYRNDTTRSRDGEEIEDGFRYANTTVLTKRESTAR